MLNNPFFYIFFISRNKKISFFYFLLHPLIKSLAIILPSFFIRELVRSGGNIEGVGSSSIFLFIFGYIFFLAFYFLYIRVYQYFFQTRFYAWLKKTVIIETVKNLIDNSKSFFYFYPPVEVAHLLIHLNENIIDLIRLSLDNILPTAFSCIGLSIFLSYYNIYCGFLLFLWVLFILGFSFFITKKMDTAMGPLIRHKSKVSDFIVDVFFNISLVQIFCNQKGEIEHLKENVESIEDQECSVGFEYQKMSVIYNGSFIGVTFVSCCILCIEYVQGTIFLDDIILWWSVVSSIFSLSESFMDNVLQIPRFYYGMKESLDVLTISDKVSGKNLLEYKRGKIEFCNVSFSFENKVILDNFSLIIEPQEKVAIVGFSGSGKSTLFFLLLRMYSPQKGTILIDDQDISQISIESLYSLFGVVLQNNSIFNRDVFNNILYGDSADISVIDKKKFEQILDFSGLRNTFLEKNGAAYYSKDSKLFENAKVFSGGEQQRISIARALYRNAPILLFDEPTSNIDSVTEGKIMKSLYCFSEEKTLLLITHNFHILPNFDRIIMFDSGKVVQDGMHDELIQDQDGLYFKLCNLGKIV